MPHLGNLLGSLLSGDVFARFYRLRGFDTLYVSGTDMHGTMAEFEAMKQKVDVAKLLAENHIKLKKLIEDFNIKFDNYTNTESEIHKEFVTAFYEKADDKGYITTKTEKRAYCKNCKIFLADAFIEGTCPYCKAENAKGNQCDACGKLLEPEELLNPFCRVCRKKDITFKETKHWFLNLTKLKDKLKEYVGSHPEWQGNVKSMTENMLKDLKPRAVTRDLKWGIPAPFEGAENKVIYVWMEAALGYVSATKEHTEKWTDFWFGNNVKQIYTIGKDNIPFHTIIFPAQLLATEENYHLPDQLAATEYLNWEGNQKFSKSRNIGIFMDDALKLLPADHWRFYLLYDRPESKDTAFSWKELDKAINQILIGDIGNLINRTLTFTYKTFKGEIPKAKLNDEDEDMLDHIAETGEAMIKRIESGSLKGALEEIIKLSKKGNVYFQQREPWKNEPVRANTLYVCAQVTKALAIFLEPFVPKISEKIWHILNINQKISWKELEIELPAGHKINTPEIIAEKFDIENVKKKYAEMKK
jgi:methionyl-tRNA synthetase